MNQISGSWQRNLAVVWLSQFISMASFSSAYTFMPFFFRQLGVTGDEELSHYVALFSVAGNLTFCIFAPIWGMVADVYGRRMMLIRANFGGALLMPLLAVITSPDLIIVHRLFLGALTGTVSAAQTLIISTTPKEHRSFALGAIASALFGGMMAGQFLGGGLVQRFGFNWTFAGSGVLLFVSGMLVLIWGRENFTRTETLRERVRSIRWRIPRFGVIWYLMVLFVERLDQRILFSGRYCFGAAARFSGRKAAVHPGAGRGDRDRGSSADRAEHEPPCRRAARRAFADDSGDRRR